ncbi:MAG: hypothetical protein KF791_08525 [Verrucomicrobiae bacterium]|nr:hypothetical protein [Verrucomicrobiae bacterium]
MKRGAANSAQRSPRRQQTPQEIRDTILGFIGRHFYGGDHVAVAKDTPRLLRWVVLKPAEWLDERGVTISADSYRDLFLDSRSGVLMEAIRHGDIGSIRYRPAWLGQVVDSYLRIRGDRLYELAKRHQASLVGDLMAQVVAAVGGRTPESRPDPVRQLAQAAHLLKPAMRRPRPRQDSQLFLL